LASIATRLLSTPPADVALCSVVKAEFLDRVASLSVER
jgi:hypothetical protein